jgi:hypothetical protein
MDGLVHSNSKQRCQSRYENMLCNIVLQVLEGCSFITSMPDVSELFPMSLSEWRGWFTAAAALVLGRCPDDGVAIFFQTDIKVCLFLLFVFTEYLISSSSSSVVAVAVPDDGNGMSDGHQGEPLSVIKCSTLLNA